jgi:general secretion pathway protein G
MKKLVRGFTLVELLIVIAIIGILVSLGTVSYSSAQQKGRDGRRKSDLRSIQNAWEQYYADNDAVYPSSCSVGTTYLPAGVPTDPKSGASYTSTCTSSTYCFCATLEGGAGNASGTTCTFGTGSYYCVANLQ